MICDYIVLKIKFTEPYAHYLIFCYNHWINMIISLPSSTVDNSVQWKLWHSIVYMIGGITFFIGSAFPHLNHYLPAATISAWLYTIGSIAFVTADFT